MDDDIVRILVSTDNHLGFAERDPVRCDDCFAAFEEVLATARKKQVDFVLMAGDMFHENKPTRRTLHNTMELLRKYCLGDDPVFTAILNDQKEVFKSGFGKVNYEDPYQSVCLPVFSIHGNHDDPSREGGGGEALAALDLLAVSNLINYFGKADRVEDIEITPILIRKGGTSLAIYGLGAIRDERLNRMWNQKNVKFVRLTEEQGREDFFNIFVLHQNRDYGRGAKNCVHESMIPEWMDLVIWGNEHECQPQLTESLVGTYRILQPGSSIASSYSSTESSLCPKHMAFFEIKEKKFRMRAIPYRQVRQFLYRDISLRDFPHLDPNHSKIEEQIKDILTTKINEMILEGRAAIEDQPAEELEGIKYRLRDPQKILVRLRVDHEGFPALNQQRFGTHFVGEVANPADVLLFAKKRKEGNFRATEGKLSSRTHVGQEDIKKILAEGAEDEINKIKIEDLVNETLANSNHTLALLAETEMAQALDDYIVKKQPNAIIDLVNESLNRTQKALNADKSADDKAAILKATARVKQKTEEDIAKETGKKVVRDTLRGLDAAASSNNKGTKGRLAAASDDEENSVAPKRGAAASKKGATTGGAKAGAAATSSKRGGGGGSRRSKAQQQDSEEGSDDDFDVGSEAEFQRAPVGRDSDDAGLGDGSDDSDAPKKGRARGTAAATGKGAAKTTAAKSKKVAASPAPATKKRATAPAAKKAPAASARGTTKWAAAAKAVKYAHDSDEDRSDEAGISDDDDSARAGRDSDAAEDALLGSSDGGSDAESPDDDVSDEDEPVRGKAKKKAPPKRTPAASSSKTKTCSSAASKAKPTATTSGSSKSAATAGRTGGGSVVVDLDGEDEEYDDTRYTAGKSSASASVGKAKATPVRATPAATSRGTAATAAEVIDLDADDDIVDDDGFMHSAAGASASLKSATGTQQSALRLPGGTVGRKRQLPLSFSQAPPSQSGAKKAASSNKSLVSGWDD